MRFLSPAGMREVDRATIAGGTSGWALMQAAGRAVAEETLALFPGSHRAALALCGTGNNGGDGFVAARELRRSYARVAVALAGAATKLRGDAAVAAAAYRESGGELVEVRSAEELRAVLGGREVVLDALLGTGTRGELHGLTRELLEVVSTVGGPVVAVDTPSGLDPATGRLLGPVAPAALTVTFGAPKLGHVLGSGPDVVGRIVVRDIGLDPSALRQAGERPDAARSLSAGDAERLLPLPRRRSHKRNNGVVGVIAGSRAYLGAALLTCRGAVAAGAGLVHALVPDELKGPLAASLPEAIGLALPVEAHGGLGPAARPLVDRFLEAVRPDVVVIGPGLGSEDETRALCRDLLRDLGSRAAAGARLPALVLDADALNAFEGRREELEHILQNYGGRTALTPHPGELGRILERRSGEIDEERLDVARSSAAAFRCPVLLKGAPTVVAAHDGVPFVNLTGGPALARGGTGDLLAGVSGALLGKGMEAVDALALAAFVHGFASDLARRHAGTLSAGAGETARWLARALRALERRETALVARRLDVPWAWSLAEQGS